MKYLKAYDVMFEEFFQIEIDKKEEKKIPYLELSKTPYQNLPIKSRFRSNRHPGWNKQ